MQKLFLVGAAAMVTLGSASATEVPYEVQSRCSNDAAAFFNRQLELWRANDTALEGGKPQPHNRTYNYHNNYSPTMSGCFIVIEHAEGASSGWREYGATLYNVSTHRELGHFGIGTTYDLTTHKMSNNEDQLLSCEFNGAQCTSEAEWQTLVK